MKLLDAVRMALHTIVNQKLKSFFSMIGVLIGVTFLIAVVSIITGMNKYMEDKFANALIGLNTFQLSKFPQINTGNVTRDMWLSWQRRPRISYADADYLQARIQTPVTVARYCQDREVFTVNGKQGKDIGLVGTEPSYFKVMNYDLSEGRAITEQELRLGSPVMVIGSLVAEKFFPGVDPLGHEVQVAGIPYRVIGVVASQGTLFGISLDKFGIVPYSSPARRLICPIGMVDYVSFQAATPQAMLSARNEVEALMRTRRHLKPQDEDNFDLSSSENALAGWKKISGFLMMALPLLVGIGLVVGGIVIMNIMLVSVTERTREIGVRKALGARHWDILFQFLVESATLSTVGAAMGIATGFALAFAFSALTPLPAAVAPWSVIVGVGVGMGVGVIAGVYPASRAAKLDPIAALRTE
ncbi:MAG TPA: ABC transporter permease [Gemmatimonadales bacterium]|nr:ABC transporter permease [Gemmatimonadales bacterium]